MTTIDYIVLVLYFLAMAVIGVWSMLKIKKQEDFFLGGRSFGKLLQAVGLAAVEVDISLDAGYLGVVIAQFQLQHLIVNHGDRLAFFELVPDLGHPDQSPAEFGGNFRIARADHRPGQAYYRTDLSLDDGGQLNGGLGQLGRSGLGPDR